MGTCPLAGNRSGLGLTHCVRPAAGNIDVSRVTQSSFVAEAKSSRFPPPSVDGYKDFFISLSGDPGPQASRAVPSAGRSYAAAHSCAAEFDGIVGRGACPAAGPEPAARVAPCANPFRFGPGRPPQGRQLGLPSAGRTRTDGVAVRAGSRYRPGCRSAICGRCGAAGYDPRRSGRGRSPLFRSACSHLGECSLAAHCRRRDRAGNRCASGRAPVGCASGYRHRYGTDAGAVRAQGRQRDRHRSFIRNASPCPS